jgi:hypothetical protein
MLHALPHEDVTGLLRRRSLDRKPWLKRLAQTDRPRPHAQQAVRPAQRQLPPPPHSA